MKYRPFIVLFTILSIFALNCPVFALPCLNIAFNQALWEKSEEMGTLISAYNEKENPPKSKLIKIYGSNKRGMRYHANVNPSNGETQIYIYRGDKLVIKMHGIKMHSNKKAANYATKKRLYAMTNVPALSSRAGRIIETAKQYLGTPYRWGGTTPNGFDCSGFTMKIFKINGVNIQRCADEQYYQGNYISDDEMLPGDLVFFSTYTSGASHVGIYIGDDKFIHASSRYGVTVSSLNDAYYNSCYLGARRMW